MRRTNPSRSSPHFVLVSSLGLGDRLWQNSLSVLAAFANKHLIKQEDYCPIATLSIKLISKLRGWQKGAKGGGGGWGGVPITYQAEFFRDEITHYGEQF